MKIVTLVTAAMLSSTSPVHVHAEPPPAEANAQREPAGEAERSSVLEERAEGLERGTEIRANRERAWESNFGADPLDASFPADTLVGNWWTEGKEGKMRIEKTKSGRYQVIISSGKDEDKKDVNNPDPKLRERKLKGIVIMWNLKFEDGEYVDGYCYNPRDGNTYRVKMKITGQNSLRIRGYLLIPLLGQSQDWVRAA
jgi:uncharacterized protein (DUF2147 family)